MKTLSQSLMIILSCAFVFVWEQTGLKVATVPLLGLMVAVFLVYQFLNRKKKEGKKLVINGSVGIVLLNTMILLIIFETNALASPLYFLIYFLCFGISFVFEPITVFIFAIAVIALFMPNVLQNDIFENAIRVGSLLLIAPLGFFFGREFGREEKLEAEKEAMQEVDRDVADTIAEDVSEVLKDNAKVLKPSQVDKLSEILEETQTLREQSEKTE